MHAVMKGAVFMMCLMGASEAAGIKLHHAHHVPVAVIRRAKHLSTCHTVPVLYSSLIISTIHWTANHEAITCPNPSSLPGHSSSYDWLTPTPLSLPLSLFFCPSFFSLSFSSLTPVFVCLFISRRKCRHHDHLLHHTLVLHILLCHHQIIQCHYVPRQ